MCDDFTIEAEDANLAKRGLTRREFGALGAQAALGAALAGCKSDSQARLEELAENGMKAETVTIKTDDGMLDAFFIRPEAGIFPGVIMWPDVAGLREAHMVMARELAAAGYAVIVPNQYYRGAVAPILNTFVEWRTPEGKAKLGSFRDALTPAAITRDSGKLVAFLDAQEGVNSNRRIGACGYCMGGPFAVRTAAAVPDRVRAAASFHGGRLVTDAFDSPHRMMAQTKASFLFAIARNDDAKDPTAKDALRSVAEAEGRNAEIDVYDADHGWCVFDSPSYDPGEAEKAYKRMLELFAEL